MNCQRFEDVVNDITREQIIDEGLRSEALKHSENCERCGARLEDERAMTLHLRNLTENLKSAGAPARVEARLLAEFDKFAAMQFPAPPLPAQQYRAQYVIGAIAALLLIVFGLFAIRGPVPGPRATGAPLVATTLVPANTGITTTSSPPIIMQKPLGPAGSGKKSAARHRHNASARTPAADAGTAEIATDFLPLTYGAAANLEEGGRMVRVELPHSALATFGLPVNIDRANERVKADVLFGVDGLAHAICFIR
jgi:hypothetical protein